MSTFIGSITEEGSLALTIVSGQWSDTVIEVSDIEFSDGAAYEEDGTEYSDLNCNLIISELYKDSELCSREDEHNSNEFKQWLRIHLGKFFEQALRASLYLDDENSVDDDSEDAATDDINTSQLTINSDD